MNPNAALALTQPSRNPSFICLYRLTQHNLPSLRPPPKCLLEHLPQPNPLPLLIHALNQNHIMQIPLRLLPLLWNIVRPRLALLHRKALRARNRIEFLLRRRRPADPALVQDDRLAPVARVVGDMAPHEVAGQLVRRRLSGAPYVQEGVPSPELQDGDEGELEAVGLRVVGCYDAAEGVVSERDLEVARRIPFLKYIS
jgi:hypothetical protein